ncbi:MAG TPA: zinc-binding dehydrogenase [Streptosporangiaceae bacterium]|jgi:NADPH:quinone reductase-like Zn-dependent oxidoreductase
MAAQIPPRALQLRSLVTANQTLELFLADVEVPEPGPGEVVVRVEASPINPSDLGLLLAGADLDAAVAGGSADRPTVTAPLPDSVMGALKARVGIPMPVGNEGSGTVAAAGSSAVAQALLGRTVAVAGGAMYAQYRCVDASLCLELPEGTPAVDGASSFVNPMTALGMIETMRLEDHTGLVHTAAASNLGQMLNRLCLAEQVPLVSIVRKHEQEELLRSAGATYVCNSTSPDFLPELTAALQATGATLAFDAIGGGKLASQILTCMEEAASAAAETYSRYGSSVHKQVYIYGSLDRGPTELTRNFGLAWGIGGWLLIPFLQKIGLDGMQRLRQRVAAELTTTFASNYTDQVSLAGALQLDTLAAYAQQATGSKYLIVSTASGR